jgi:hypothetical protein
MFDFEIAALQFYALPSPYFGLECFVHVQFCDYSTALLIKISRRSGLLRSGTFGLLRASSGDLARMPLLLMPRRGL